MRRQTVDLELIVIIDDSKDDSVSAVAAEHPDLRLIVDDVNRGVPVQRNRGTREASGSIVFWLDDDAELQSPYTVAQTLGAFDHPRVGAVSIPYLEPSRGPGIRQGYPPGPGRWITDSFLGCAAAVDREKFLAVGGFDESLFMEGEEPDVCAKMLARGWVTVVAQGDAVVHHISDVRDSPLRAKLATRSQFLIPMRYGSGPPLAADLAVRLAISTTRAVRTRSPGGVFAGILSALRAVRQPGARTPLPRRLFRLRQKLEVERLRRRLRTQLHDVEHILPPCETPEHEIT